MSRAAASRRLPAPNDVVAASQLTKSSRTRTCQATSDRRRKMNDGAIRREHRQAGDPPAAPSPAQVRRSGMATSSGRPSMHEHAKGPAARRGLMVESGWGAVRPKRAWVGLLSFQQMYRAALRAEEDANSTHTITPLLRPGRIAAARRADKRRPAAHAQPRRR